MELGGFSRVASLIETARAEAARELKRAEEKAQASMLEWRRKAAADLAQLTSQLREARGDSEAQASSLRAEVSMIRAQSEEDAASSTSKLA